MLWVVSKNDESPSSLCVPFSYPLAPLWLSPLHLLPFSALLSHVFGCRVMLGAYNIIEQKYFTPRRVYRPRAWGWWFRSGRIVDGLDVIVAVAPPFASGCIARVNESRSGSEN